ncbi:MAG: succinylglutamate desuccinylase [Alcaligenaceae bacterium]|nr:succinylglutamate desuccinylase [Alcaligenaceae bacterium]
MLFDLPYPDLSFERTGNTGTPGVWHFNSGQPGRSLLITSLIHGNELCGAWALKALLASGLKPETGSLTLAFCNLDGYDAFDALNHDASRFVDEDLNRVWQSNKLTSPSTRERQRAAALLPWVKQADWLLDLHSMHEPGDPLLLTGTLPRNIALARQLAAPEHVIVDAGHKDGTRLRDFQQFGDPARDDACALLIECGFHGDTRSVAVAKDMVARMLKASGICSEEKIPSEWFLQNHADQRILQVTHAIVAPSMNVRFAKNWQGLETLRHAGEVIGWIDDTPVVTPYDKCTLIMPSLRQLKPGVTVVRLAQDYTESAE